MKAEISKGANETSELPAKPSRRNLEWSGKWEDMGQILKEFSDPIVWDFPSEQIQNSAEVAKYLKEKCHGNTKEKRIIAVSWALAYVYRTLLDTEGRQTEDREQVDKLVTIRITQAAANIPGSGPVAESDSRRATTLQPYNQGLLLLIEEAESVQLRPIARWRMMMIIQEKDLHQNQKPH
ncbi:hypothetical protein HGM15179_008549 [Zosterops borbonicus]|uniref:Uncharacterized protein n=1 Tax=Zosterops borbonicus TaxID=364589 RepID=A0A8K1LLF0_9PASS|nr:hypothetical protein HGM15179_008549 [Zosterops borbonicus]